MVVDELKIDFSIRRDIDLFENPPNDIHTVSSLLKGYLRSCKHSQSFILVWF